MTQRIPRLVTLLFAVLFVLPCLAWGQARTEGQLGGTVVDPSGATVPGARLILSQAATGFSTTVTANSSGVYVFPDVQPGTYTMTASASGFSTQTYNNVVVYAGRTTDLKIELKVGTSSQTVEVSAQGEVLETTSNTLATTVTGDSIQNLPLAGRDALPFAELVPGAESGGDQRFTTYNALPNGAVNISVDGMNDNFQRYRTSTTGFFTAAPLRLGAIDEMTVSTDDLTADAGAEGAVTIRVTTKHGTNQFHGNAFWQAQNSFFNANSYYGDALLAAGNPSGQKSSYHINDYGGGVGGPILRNRLFFYFNFEYENQPGNFLDSQNLLTPAAQTGSFTYTRADNGQQQTVNLLTIAAAHGNPSTINSVIASELQTINGYTGSGTLAPSTALPTLQNVLNWQQGTDYKQEYPFLRLDYQITQNILWHASYNMYWRTIANTPPYPGDPNAGNGFQSTYSTLATGVDWTITPRLVNQASFGLLNTQEEFNPGNSFDVFKGATYVLSAPGFTNGGSALSPVIPSTPYSIIPEPRNNPVWNVSDNITWTRGNHTFTFGGDLRISNSHDTADFPPPAENLFVSSLDPALNMFSDSSSAGFPGGLCGTGPGCANVTNSQDLNNAEGLYATLAGDVGSISGTNWRDSATGDYKIGGLALFLEKQTVGGLYFQDAWKATPHLSFNYGFRWQFSGAVHNTNNLYTSPTYADLLGPSSQLFQPGLIDGITNPQIYLRPSPYKADMIQPAPNFGFAWNPDFESGFLGKLFGGSNTVIRGGAGISHYDEGWTTFEQVASGNPGLLQSVFLNVGQFPAGSITLGGPTPALSAFPATSAFPIPESDFTFGFQNFGTVNPNIRSPYVENWTFGIQRKLPGDTVLEVNYVGNHSVHMWSVYDLNEISVTGNGFLPDFQNAQKNLVLGGGTSFADTGANPTPLLDQAFGGTNNSNFTNSTFITWLQQGQAGSLANAIASNQTFFCNLVGNGGGVFTPCINAGYNSPTPYPINIFQANPFASGQALQYLSDPGSENYNGLQVNVKHPVGHGLNLMVNYAYSHSFTNRYIGDYYTADEALMNFTTLRDPGLNRVPSPYDLRHVFRIYLTYELPFGEGKIFSSGSRLINDVIGGWTVGGIFTAQTGRNFKLAGGQNAFNYYASGSGQPDTSDSGVVLNGITSSQLQSAVGVYPGPSPFNPIVLLPASIQSTGKLAPESTPGQLGDFLFLHGPHFIDTDISIIKNIPIWERVRFNIYGEFLNAFNHPNWNLTDSFSGSTNNPAQYLYVNAQPFAYGSLAQSGNRTIQFRLQLAF